MQRVLSDTRRPVKIWASDLEPEAEKQVRNIADLPFIYKHVAVMPDAHAGKGSTVGTIAELCKDNDKLRAQLQQSRNETEDWKRRYNGLVERRPDTQQLLSQSALGWAIEAIDYQHTDCPRCRIVADAYKKAHPEKESTRGV